MISASDEYTQKRNSIVKNCIIGVVVLIVLGFILASFEVVNAGEKGVVTQWGKVDRVLDEGFHVVNPISENVHTMNTRVQVLNVVADASSKDLQEVTTTIQLNFHYDPASVDTLYQSVQRPYDATIIMPQVQEAVKAGTAKFTAEEQINKRSEVKAAIEEDLRPRLSKFFVIMDSVNIADLSFSSEFDKAIEQKQVAEQLAQKAANDLDRVKLEQQQAIEGAKAEAEKTRLQVQALMNDSRIIELRKAEAFLAFAQKWGGKMPDTVIIGDGGALPLLNLGQ